MKSRTRTKDESNGFDNGKLYRMGTIATATGTGTRKSRTFGNGESEENILAPPQNVILQVSSFESTSYARTLIETDLAIEDV